MDTFTAFTNCPNPMARIRVLLGTGQGRRSFTNGFQDWIEKGKAMSLETNRRKMTFTRVKTPFSQSSRVGID